MKNHISILYAIVAIAIVNSCANPERAIPVDTTIHIDSLAVSPFQYSSYFEQIDYIPLEASGESLIGYVHNIHVYNDIFFLLDITTARRLFLFNLDGTFINAIGESGSGKGKFQKIVDFSIEPQAEEIYVLDQIGKIIVFDFDGNMLREINISGQPRHLYNGLEIVGNSIFLDIRYPLATLGDQNYLLREVTLEGEFKKDWLDMDTVNKGVGRLYQSNITKSFYVTPNGVFYTKEFMEGIYQLEEDQVSVFKAIESQFRFTNEEVSSMYSSENFYTEAANFDKVFRLANVTSGVNFTYFSYKKGPAPFSVVKQNDVTSLHQYWIDDVSFSGRTFQTQPPHFFAASQDGKTLIGLSNGKNKWLSDIEITNRYIGGIDPEVFDSFEQKFQHVDNPILILYRLK